MSPDYTAERRQLTVMFVDLVGSTALSHRLDPEDLREILSAYHHCVAEQVAALDGFVAKYMGDGVLVYFGYPRAHEDDAERAVRTGLAILNAVGRLEAPETLQARIGVATGLVVVGEVIGSGESQERGIIGETPNLAARLQALAQPNALVIGPRTHLLLRDLFDYHDLGEVRVKGLDHAVHAYEVLGLSALESRFEALHALRLTTLVGRDKEIELLLHHWDSAKRGTGQVVLISGEPGIGKSRLAAAVLGRIGKQPHTRLRFFCSPYHSDSAFYPIINQMERAAAFQRNDDVHRKTDKLDTLLEQASATPEDKRLIADLLSLPDVGRFPVLALSPQQRRLGTMEALLRQLEGLAYQRPVLQVFEDIHWMDPTSLELVDRIVELVRRLPVLLLLTHRPDFNPSWTTQSHVTMMTLGRLDSNHGMALIAGIAGHETLPAEILNEIIDRTDGVPLFVEELTKAILEAGLHDPEAASALSKAPSRTVPATLHASLMSRLDRLGPAKDLAQIGAAIGREFSHELLAGVSSFSELELRGGLNQLVASGLVIGHGMPPESSYMFKHALVQDVAYNTLLRRNRQQLHAKIAQTLEERYSDQVAREPEVLARHFAEAQQPARALEYWVKAGGQATERSANLEAIRHFGRALEALKLLPESVERDRQELAVQSAIGTPLIAVHGYAAPETGVAFGRARELGAKLEDANALFSTLSGQWAFHFVRGDHELMRQLADEALLRSEEMHDEALELAGYRMTGCNSLYFGNFEQSRSEFDTILRLYDATLHRPPPLHYVHDPKFYAIAYLPLIYWVLGYPDRARVWQKAALDYTSELNQAVLATHVRIYGGAGLDELLFEPRRVRTYADAITELADQHNLRYFRLSGQILRGWTIAQTESGKEGLAIMRQSATERLAMGVTWYQIRYLCMLAETYLLHNSANEGLMAITEAKELVARTDEHMWESEIIRIEGELRWMQGFSLAEVASHFRKALAIARGQGARSFELRAGVSFARLLTEEGRRAEARDLLAPIYAWFVEGFDTVDYKRAKALLDELSD